MTSAPEPRRLMTTGEAADYLRLAVATLEKLRITGGGPTYRKLGRSRQAKVVYIREDLDVWLERFVFNSTSEYGREKE